MQLIPPKYFVAFALALILIGTDDLSHSCSHAYFTPNFTFAFAFVILDLINSEIVLFRFASISVSMVCYGKFWPDFGEKTHKEKAHKQNFHGIVPGFLGGGVVYVFFHPHKE